MTDDDDDLNDAAYPRGQPPWADPEDPAVAEEATFSSVQGTCSGGPSSVTSGPIPICVAPGDGTGPTIGTAQCPTPWLEPMGLGFYSLSAAAKSILAQVFTNTPNPGIRFGRPAGWNNSAITLPSWWMGQLAPPCVIFLDADSFYSAATIVGDDGTKVPDPKRPLRAAQIATIAHEFTHVPQWLKLGMPAFLARYKREFSQSDNYDIPFDLTQTPPTALEPDFVNANWTLDQMAQRMGLLAWTTAGYPPPPGCVPYSSPDEPTDPSCDP